MRHISTFSSCTSQNSPASVGPLTPLIFSCTGVRFVIVVVLTVKVTVDAAGAEVGLPVGAEIGACVVKLGAAEAALAASKASNIEYDGMACLTKLTAALRSEREGLRSSRSVVSDLGRDEG